MRPADGKMMKLVKYNLTGEAGDADADTVEITHNHFLDVDNTDIDADDGE